MMIIAIVHCHSQVRKQRNQFIITTSPQELVFFTWVFFSGVVSGIFLFPVLGLMYKRISRLPEGTRLAVATFLAGEEEVLVLAVVCLDEVFFAEGLLLTEGLVVCEAILLKGFESDEPL